MLLNDILMENKMRMPDAFKKSLVSAFGHLTSEDQKYIVYNIEKFIPKTSKVYFPYINDHIPGFLVSLEYALTTSGYTVDRYDISVEHPAVSPNDIIIANDMSKLYRLLWKENKDFTIINMLCTITYEHPKDLFLTFISLSNYIIDKELDPFIYPDAMTALAIYYDIVATLIINSIGLSTSYMIQTQTRAFSYMCSMLKDEVPTNPLSYSRQVLLLELNILTSLVSIGDVEKNISCLMTPKMMCAIDNDMNLSDINQVLSLIKKRSTENPFVASKFNIYKRPNIKGWSFAEDKNIYKSNRDLMELIESTTREEIKNIIENKTGVLEDINNISFDIPESLLSMYQLEFSREHPITMVPIPVDNMIDRDGSDWRNIIHYDNDMLIAFYLKDSSKKLYGIHMYHYYDEHECTLVEFTGKENGTYEFIY